jgi:VanZ family protein
MPVACPPFLRHWFARLLAAATLVYVAVLVFATHYPKPEELLGPNPPSDKTLHFLAYGTLAVLAATTCVAAARWSGRSIAWLALGMAAFGAVDEITQPLFGRSAEPLDWVYDCIGSVAGLLLVAVVVATIHRLSPRETPWV